ncbi:hypothetical protein AYO22_03378 [Fonsecaea multimorphosa]|nr:hypothetical protein AYO22_03378 [Fonsecaea multimorphosa]
MTGAQEIPEIVVTPPPEDGPTSTVSILAARHWGLWARGALRKLDRTSAKGQNYSTKPDGDVELVELPSAAPAAATPLNERNEEADRRRTKEASHERFVENGVDRSAVSESDRLIFCKKHVAVLESIRFRGEMMHAFEQECKEPWFKPIDFEDDLPPLLPPTMHIRMKAEELLKDFAENPVPNIKDMLEAKRRHKTSVCKAWNEMLETDERNVGGRPLFEPVVLDVWKLREIEGVLAGIGTLLTSGYGSN